MLHLCRLQSEAALGGSDELVRLNSTPNNNWPAHTCKSWLATASHKAIDTRLLVAWEKY